jgi:hypothetical protein
MWSGKVILAFEGTLTKTTSAEMRIGDEVGYVANMGNFFALRTVEDIVNLTDNSGIEECLFAAYTRCIAGSGDRMEDFEIEICEAMHVSVSPLKTLSKFAGMKVNIFSFGKVQS